MSMLDWAIAQAQGGQCADAGVFQLRSEHEAKLRDKYKTLQALCDQANTLLCTLEADVPAPPDLTAEIDALLARAKTELVEKKEALSFACNAVEDFRQRHGISRPPKLRPITLSLVQLGLMGVIETGVNAAFLQNAHMVAGPFAALLTSAVFSLTNIALSASAGYFLGRWTHYGENALDTDAPFFKRIRLRARWGLRGFICVMVGFHVTVGLVRATESLDRVPHGLSHYAELLASPEAVFLMLTGSVFSVLAFHKGRTAFGDPVPGYGSRNREYQSLQEDISDLHDEYTDAIKSGFDGAERHIAKVRKRRQAQFTAYNRVVSECQKAHRELDSTLSAAQSDMQRQVALLATAQRAGRGRKPKAVERVLDNLVNFDDFTSIELPMYKQETGSDTQQAELALAKSDALTRLGALFQYGHSSEQGDEL